MSELGAMPLYLAIILARANAYSRASATLRLSSTVDISESFHYEMKWYPDNK